MEKMVRVEWIDSTTISGSSAREEYNAFASRYDDLSQVSIGFLTHEYDTHIVLASMIAEDGPIGLAVKIPKFAVTKIEELKVKDENNKNKKR